MNLCRDVVICGISSFICLYLVNFPVVLCLIWEDDSYVDENTLSVNINRLRKKLEAIGLEEFIITKKGIGYRV